MSLVAGNQFKPWEWNYQQLPLKSFFSTRLNSLVFIFVSYEHSKRNYLRQYSWNSIMNQLLEQNQTCRCYICSRQIINHSWFVEVFVETVWNSTYMYMETIYFMWSWVLLLFQTLISNNYDVCIHSSLYPEPAGVGHHWDRGGDRGRQEGLVQDQASGSGE